MNLVLILREELVCLIILVFLFFLSRAYRMGKEGRIFHLILTFALAHVVLDGVTVWTVNHTDTVPRVVNDLLRGAFYLSAILFSVAICQYVVNLCYPRQAERNWWISLIPAGLYLVLLPVCLPIEYQPFNGTWASVGPAPTVGYAIALGYFAVAVAIILKNWQLVGRHIRATLLPMLLLLFVVVLIQSQVKELLFTGGAISIIVVAFFFTLENPAAVLERKTMMDIMNGLGSRSSYERDMAVYDREFEANRETKFTFLFVDINNLRSINGLYGHEEGDAYITSVAALLLNNLRGAEHIYRMGGDEFLAIYRKADEKVVIRDITRVHEACAKGRTRKEYTPELAIGYAVSDRKYNSLRDVLRVADYMMFRNKADLKREIAEGALHPNGTHLNLSGLTDRFFDAMCLTSEEYYPFLMNMETYVTRIAPAWMEFFGMGSEFIDDFADVWEKRVHPDDLQEYRADITATLTGKKQYHYCKYRARTLDGTYVQVTCRGGVYHGRDGEPDVFAGYMVNHGAPTTIDASTGLMNYHLLYDRLEDELQTRASAILICFTIRNLDRIRVLYSGETAATLLHSMGALLLKTAGDRGEVFSNNGVSYAIYLPDSDEETAKQMYLELRDACVAGVETDGTIIPVSLAAGALRLPSETLKTPSAIRGAALFAVEEAMYNPQNTLIFFEDGSGATDEAMAIMQQVHRDCVNNRERFYLRYQPIVKAQTGRVTGAEALLRWKTPEYGEVSPGRFISFLENDPAYSPLGFDILRLAVRQAGEIMRDLPDFRINVNITALQLNSESFIPEMLRILEEEHFPPEHLILELTERCKEMEFSFLKEQVRRLKEAGIRVALDDMGTGYSTIDLLLHVDADEIKLDMTFTQEMRQNQNAELLARVLSDSALKQGKELCFEGVESGEMAEYLKGYGDVLLQGYLFDKPLMAEEFIAKYCDPIQDS